MGGAGKPVCSRENKGDQNGDMTRLPGDVENLIRDTTMKDERGGTERIHKRTTDIWHPAEITGQAHLLSHLVMAF